MKLENLVSPVDRKPIATISDTALVFEGGQSYPLCNTIPILIRNETGLFDINDIIAQKPQTQNKAYLDKSNLKNYIRRNILPTLSADHNFEKRYVLLAERVKGKRVLVVGAGDKVEYYKTIFQHSEVITSDVHMQFSPDVVFDVHEIPFPDNFFHLVIAGQVMEHTIRPWLAASELQRVSAVGGWLQIEVPFGFPYHAAPYDFFRFTFTGMRSLFPNCELHSFKATEGIFSAIAVLNTQALVETSQNKYLRQCMLVISRFSFFWLKYLDRFKKGIRINDFMMPKGFYMTFLKDGTLRNDQECLKDFERLRG